MKWNKVCIIFSQKIPSIARPGALVKAKLRTTKRILIKNEFSQIWTFYVILICVLQSGVFKKEIVPVSVPQRKGKLLFEQSLCFVKSSWKSCFVTFGPLLGD